MFVILSAAMPSRLLTAFPPEVSVSRVPLDVAIERVRATADSASGGGEPVARALDEPARPRSPRRCGGAGASTRHRRAAGRGAAGDAAVPASIRCRSLSREQLLDAADGIALLVEQAVDAPRQRDVGGPVIAAVAGALQRPQLRETWFPNSAGYAGRRRARRQFADRPEGVRGLCRRSPSPCLLGDPVAHDLAGAEGHHPARRDRHFDAGLGIAADPLALVAQDEAAEAGNLDVLALGQARGTYGGARARPCSALSARDRPSSRCERCRPGRRGSACPRADRSFDRAIPAIGHNILRPLRRAPPPRLSLR